MKTAKEFFDFLLHKKILSETDQNAVKTLMKISKISFVNSLAEKKLIKTDLLAYLTAQFFQLPLMDLQTLQPDRLPFCQLAKKWLNEYKILPLFEKDNYLLIAVVDPLQLIIFDEIKFATNCILQMVIVDAEKLQKIYQKRSVEKHFHSCTTYSSAKLQMSFLPVVSADIDDGSIVNYVQNILFDAVSKQASDIHFEAYCEFYRIRFRIDGMLYEVARPPIHLAKRIAARIKILAELDIAEQRIPQDGHFQQIIDADKTIDCRVSTCPIHGAEKIVVRLLGATKNALLIDDLGLLHDQQLLIKQAIEKPQGLFIVAGPTGSGKTITLYSLLNWLNSGLVNIVTAEDPIELNIPGINQSTTNKKAGISFANLLRAFLRQDPDIIMVGEIRDLETAEIAFKAAQTGHLVLATLHANNAVSVITRLLNMGVAAYNIANSLELVIAQRLVRCLCHDCKKIDKIFLTAKNQSEDILKNPSAAAIFLNTNLQIKPIVNEIFCPVSEQQQQPLNASLLDKYTAYSAAGCNFCHEGYKGRTGIFELLAFNEPISQAIAEQQPQQTIRQLAKDAGMSTFHEAAFIKVAEGITSLREVYRVLGPAKL